MHTNIYEPVKLKMTYNLKWNEYILKNILLGKCIVLL
jgi:hypothetical protein